MSCAKPWPGSRPMRSAWGTGTSSSAISAVSDECMPSFSSRRDTDTPGSDVSTMNSEIPRCPPSASVFATSVRKCARAPLVMNILRPLTRHTSPSRTRARPDRGDVGAGVGLGDRDRADLLAGDRGREPPVALVVGAEVRERGRGHVGLHRDRHRDRARAAAGQLLDEHEAGREVAVAAAEARGVVEAEEAELAAAAEQRVGEAAGPLPLVDVGAHLGVDEAAHRRPQLLVLGGEDGVAGAHRGAPGRPAFGAIVVMVLRCHTGRRRVD